jgi:DNA-directed RNA polymerase specialized sigma24 family protein
MKSVQFGSITQCVLRLKAGDKESAQFLWERYFSRLVCLARKKLQACRRHGADEDEEDAALSAFDSFCAGAARGQFPQLNDRTDLWRLLVVITARKASAQAQRRRAAKRGGDWCRVRSSHTELEDTPLAELTGSEPSPEFAALVADQYRYMLARLGDEQLQHIAVARLEGYTVDEIAAQLACARRTVARRLDLIRQLWISEVA